MVWVAGIGYYRDEGLVTMRATPLRFEVMDPQMADVLRSKTGAQRLQIVDALYRTARSLIESNIRTRHPSWNDTAVRNMMARRIAGGTD